MANSEVVVKAEGLIKWLNASKTGATAQTLALNKGGLRASATLPKTIIQTDAGAFSHAKQTQAPDTSVTISALYRDKLGNLLGSATANGFEIKDAGVSCPYGTIYHEAAYGAGPSYDVLNFPNLTLMGYSISSGTDGNIIELRFAGVGDWTETTAQVSSSAITPGNAEAMIQAETYVRWKAPGATSAAKTLGFIKGGWRLSVDFRKAVVRKTDGTFSHWKTLGDPTWSLSVTQLYQDAATNYLNDTTHGFDVKGSGKTVAVGTVAVEGTFADGLTLESIQLPNATLMSRNFSQAEDGNTLELAFSGMGAPTFASATLA